MGKNDTWIITTNLLRTALNFHFKTPRIITSEQYNKARRRHGLKTGRRISVLYTSIMFHLCRDEQNFSGITRPISQLLPLIRYAYPVFSCSTIPTLVQCLFKLAPGSQLKGCELYRWWIHLWITRSSLKFRRMMVLETAWVLLFENISSSFSTRYWTRSIYPKSVLRVSFKPDVTSHLQILADHCYRIRREMWAKRIGNTLKAFRLTKR